MDEKTKTLLNDWNLMELISYFEDEGVDFAVLQIMKPHHVSELLKNFKFGTRIRFEHHLEQWRRDLGRPLKTIKQQHSYHYSSLNEETSNVVSTAAKKTVSKSTFTEKPKLVTVATQTSALPTQKSHNPYDHEDFTESSDTRQMQPVPFQNISGMNTSYSLIQILDDTGPSATSIVEFYKQHNELTVSMRSQLIQIVVSFFERHELHLSLQMSHSLEQQILKMFPTEKLENYRTEKRGKIYVKFNNMKRYRREKSLQMEKRQCLDTTEQVSLELSNSNMEREEYIITNYEEPITSEFTMKRERQSDDSWDNLNSN